MARRANIFFLYQLRCGVSDGAALNNDASVGSAGVAR